MKKQLKKILRSLNLFFLADYLGKIRFFYLRNHFPYLNINFQSSRVSQSNVAEINPELFNRIYESAKSELGYQASGEWRDIFDEYQADAVKFIRDGKKNKLLQMLANPLSNNLDNLFFCFSVSIYCSI